MLEKLIQPQLLELVRIFETIKIHVPDRKSALVQMQERKGRAGHGGVFGHPERMNRASGERGFPCAEAALEPDDVTALEEVGERLRHIERRLLAWKRELQHGGALS